MSDTELDPAARAGIDAAEKKVRWLVLGLKGIGFLLVLVIVFLLGFPILIFTAMKAGVEAEQIQAWFGAFLKPFDTLYDNWDFFEKWCDFWSQKVFRLDF